MAKNRTTQEALTIARADHESLAAELKSMQESLQATEGQLKLERRQGGDADKLRALANDVSSLRILVAGQEADAAEAAALVAELESAAEDELALAEIAAGTVAYQEAEREHREILMDTEHALARAIARSKELMLAASKAKNRASKAAHELAEKHRADRDAMFARAVNGTDVSPLTSQASLTKWPHGNRQTFRLVSQVKPTTQGVSVDEGVGDGA